MLSFFLGSDVGVGVTVAASDPKMADPDNNRSALKANDSGLSLANRTAVKALIVIVALSRNTYVAFKLIQKVSKGMKLQSNTCRMVEEFQHSIIFNDFNFRIIQFQRLLRIQQSSLPCLFTKIGDQGFRLKFFNQGNQNKPMVKNSVKFSTL